MDDFGRLTQKLAWRFLFLVFLVSGSSLGLWVAANHAGFSTLVCALIVVGFFIVLAPLVALYMARFAMHPFALVRQGILHVSSDTSRLPAPDVESLQFGRELVTSLVMNVYAMASHTEDKSTAPAVGPESVVIGGQTMLNATPLPVFTVTGASLLHYINDAGLEFLGLKVTDRSSVTGKNINDVLNLSFPSNLTYESWLTNCRDKVLKAGMSWTRVRLDDNNGSPLKQFDMAASYSKASGDIESVIVLFDHTETYAKDDQEISFVAMAVHELRTPLTIMRGYIEVFEDELGPTLQPELKDFMHKMNASAQQLTAFVSNILNVARVEENQLTLTLTKQSLQEILTNAVADLELRARVHGKHIELTVDKDVPMVAADRISVHEVINNLVDNAIKYSGKSEKIIINAKLAADMVQVDVQDFGVGIPDGVVPRLFDKFYRSHRSKVQIGGTGLGLYLCKALVGAHGGNIWVKTHEGEGSIFSFTLEPYDDAKHGAEAASQEGITRGAHGWIKNHSMYRN